MDWGEIYVDNIRARVEICNNSNKAQANHCEPQILQTTWNSTTIGVKVNQGSFADNSPQYLYILDSAETVNVSGYPLTFGSSGGGEKCPPKADQPLAEKNILHDSI